MKLVPLSWEICSDAQRATLENPETRVQEILDAWKTKYSAGLPAFDGQPLQWMEQSQGPESTPAKLAEAFQQWFKRSNDFMAAANSEVKKNDFRPLGSFLVDFNRLPKFEGITHFWISPNAKLVLDLRTMVTSRTR